MSLDALRDTLPDYAKDLRLNLGSLAAETVLTEQQSAGTFVASALAGAHATVIERDRRRIGRSSARRRWPPPRPRPPSWA